MKKILVGMVAVLMCAVGLNGLTYATSGAEMVAANGHMGNTEDYLKSTDGDAGKEEGSYVDSHKNDLMETVKIIINVVIGLVGVIAVAMIIMGGITFTTSQGDAQKVTKGKNTLLYGVIGLVVAILAFAIVNFVLGNVFGGDAGGGDDDDGSYVQELYLG